MATLSPIEQENLLYEQQLRGGLKFRNADERMKRMQTYAKIVAHNYPGADPSTETPVVNLIAARTRSIPPQLAFNAPVFDVKCVGALPHPNSEVAIAAALQQMYEHEKMHAAIRRAVLSYATFGICALFVGFELAERDDLNRVKGALGLDEGKSGATKKFLETARKMLGLTQNDKLPAVPGRPTDSVRPQQDYRAFVSDVSIFDLVLDPCATTYEDLQFIGRRLFMPYDQAKVMFGDDCPSATGVNNVAVYTDTSTEEPFGNDNKTKIDDLPDEVKRVEVWELWNIAKRKTVYLDGKTGKVIGKGENRQVHPWKSPYPGYPFDLSLIWDEVTGCVWPEGLPAAIHTINNEINAFRRRQLADGNKAFGCVLVPDTIDPESEKAIVEAKDRALVKVNPDLLEQIKPLSTQPMPADFWTAENRMRGDVNEVSRTNESIGGGMATVRRTATEAANSQSSQDAAMADRQAQVETAAVEVAQRLLAIIFTTYDKPITVRIPNQDPTLTEPDEAGNEVPVPVGELIDYDFVGVDHFGYYKITCASGSMASVAKDVERQQAIQLKTVFANDPRIDQEALDLHILSMFPSIKDPSRFILREQAPAPAPEPQAPQQPGVGGMPSDNMEADLLASTYGTSAPMTGVNGMGDPTGMMPTMM